MAFAQELRAKGNAMTDVKREDSFNLGMRLIYDGTKRTATKVGRP